MQALNLQLLETQNSKNQPKNFSSLKNEPKPGVSFRDMIKQVSRKDPSPKTTDIKYEISSKEISEPQNVENADPRKDVRTVENENPKNKTVNSDAEKLAEKDDFEAADKLEVEASETAVKAVSVEMIPSDFTVKNEINGQLTFLDNEVSEEEIQVNDSEFSFLKMKASSNDDPLAIIENAIEYESKDDLVINAQNLSLENPEKFLDGRQIANENSEASEVNVAAFGDIGQQLDAVVMNEKKEEPAFKLEVADSGSEVKSEATSLFKDIFTVTDNRSVEDKIAQFKSMVNQSSENASENNINLALSMSDNAAQNILSTNNQTAGATGSTFQEMLTQQVQTNVPDFVKAGNIVLRDNNQGTVNMILKPESLGNVKINLQVTDNVITGQITVHSKEAFEAFKQNMDSLRQAFQESGFENADLNLSFADNSSSGAFAQQGERHQSSEQFFGNKAYSNYAASADSDDYGVESVSYETGLDKQVSIVA
ncbi:flagellar hook-length control protein FliK [Treponema sp.]|uniref:flagellar hook-length control protein FliK n=1 Tax=Treponema sp. TaxID=166 RepID=UPI00388E0801